jgi:hypothetical protein
MNPLATLTRGFEETFMNRTGHPHVHECDQRR